MSRDTISHVDTPHGRLAYRVDGDDRNPVLLLTQRLRGTIDDWDPAFIDVLAQRHRVIRFDSAGVGRSEGETPGTVAEMARIALDFMDAVKIGTVDLLGWSLGGYVAQLLAANAPDRVRRLIIAGSGPGSVTEGPGKRHPRVAEIATKVSIPDSDLVFLFSADSDNSREAGQRSLDRIAANADGPPVTMASAARQLQAIGAYSGGEGAARPRLPELTMPVLVANGTTDVMVPPYGAFVISQEAPNAKLILYPDSGHGFLFQCIDDFTAEIEAFLAA